MSYLRHLRGVQHILCCVFALFFFFLCALCCQFLWIAVNFLLALRYSLMIGPSVFSNDWPFGILQRLLSSIYNVLCVIQ
jgi:hypothetical protein